MFLFISCPIHKNGTIESLLHSIFYCQLFFPASLHTSSKAALIFLEGLLDASMGEYFQFLPGAFVFCPFKNNERKRYIPLPLTSVVYPEPMAAFISLINLVVSLWLVDWADKMGCYSEPRRSLFHDITPLFAGCLHPERSGPVSAGDTGRGEIYLRMQGLALHRCRTISRHFLRCDWGQSLASW